MNAVVEYQDSNLPAAVARRGISEPAWRTAMGSLFPGAKGESVIMVFDYCKARGLDPLKKPCHIVPMEVRTQGGEYVWRDVVMPGIYEYRTTAARTGEYMGQSEAEFGPEIEFMGLMVPAWCKLTVYRWNDKAKEKCAYHARAKFSEYAGTKYDKKAQEARLNARWAKAPEQMIEKCAEAAALRKAFPDELGGTHTAEEMEGQRFSETEESVITLPTAGNPRGDVSNVDWELRDKHVEAITDLMAEYGSDETIAAQKFSEYIEAEKLNQFQELWITVHDKLAADGIISKATMKKYQKVGNQRPDGR
jgi:phage recombination protein Bet